MASNKKIIAFIFIMISIEIFFPFLSRASTPDNPSSSSGRYNEINILTINTFPGEGSKKVFKKQFAGILSQIHKSQGYTKTSHTHLTAKNYASLQSDIQNLPKEQPFSHVILLAHGNSIDDETILEIGRDRVFPASGVSLNIPLRDRAKVLYISCSILKEPTQFATERFQHLRNFIGLKSGSIFASTVDIKLDSFFDFSLDEYVVMKCDNDYTNDPFGFFMFSPVCMYQKIDQNGGILVFLGQIIAMSLNKQQIQNRRFSMASLSGMIGVLHVYSSFSLTQAYGMRLLSKTGFLSLKKNEKFFIANFIDKSIHDMSPIYPKEILNSFFTYEPE